jgi:signal peptidase II
MISRGTRFAVAASVLFADRISKYWIEQNVGAWDTLVVIPSVFQIIHTQNRGAAFGFLADADSIFRDLVLVGVSTLVMIFVAVHLWRMPKDTWPDSSKVAVALALVLGGAAGNLFDRIWRGSVTDFLQVFIGSYEWPSFNVADSAISTGTVLLILAIWRTRRHAAV